MFSYILFIIITIVLSNCVASKITKPYELSCYVIDVYLGFNVGNILLNVIAAIIIDISFIYRCNPCIGSILIGLIFIIYVGFFMFYFIDDIKIENKYKVYPPGFIIQS